MVDLNEIVRSTIREMLVEKEALFDKENWFREFYATDYSFSDAVSLSKLTNAQYEESVRDWIDCVYDQAERETYKKLGLPHCSLALATKSPLATGIEQMLIKELHDYVYIPKQEMENKLAMEKEDDSLDAVLQ